MHPNPRVRSLACGHGHWLPARRTDRPGDSRAHRGRGGVGHLPAGVSRPRHAVRRVQRGPRARRARPGRAAAAPGRDRGPHPGPRVARRAVAWPRRRGSACGRALAGSVRVGPTRDRERRQRTKTSSTIQPLSTSQPSSRWATTRSRWPRPSARRTWRRCPTTPTWAISARRPAARVSDARDRAGGCTARRRLSDPRPAGPTSGRRDRAPNRRRRRVGAARDPGCGWGDLRDLAGADPDPTRLRGDGGYGGSTPQWWRCRSRCCSPGTRWSEAGWVRGTRCWARSRWSPHAGSFSPRWRRRRRTSSCSRRSGRSWPGSWCCTPRHGGGCPASWCVSFRRRSS